MLKLLRAHHGLTLIETLIVITLFTTLSVAIFEAVTTLYKTNSYTLEQSNEVENARRGMLTWVRDAREMTYGVNGAFPIVRADANRMGFYSDIDKDLSVEYVEYVLATTTLYKFTYEATGTPAVYSTTTPTRTETLSLYVRNLTQNQPMFGYYNDSGTYLGSSTTQISDIKYINVSLIINIDPVRSPGEFLLRGSAAPRNLKENL